MGKYLFFIMFLFFYSSFTRGQSLVVTKKNIDVNTLNKIVNSKARSRILQELSSSSDYSIKTELFKTIPTNEKFFYSTDNFLYTKRYIKDSYSQGLTKYKNSAGLSELAKVYLPLEGILRFNEDKGDIVFFETGDGEGMGYFFYDENFTSKGKYIPYEGGFQYSEFDFFGDDIIIASQKEDKSTIIKLALFKKYNIILEKELSVPNSFIADIRFSKNHITLLLNNQFDSFYTIIGLDMNLNVIWNKQYSKGIYGNKLEITPQTEKILLVNVEGIECFDVSTGEFKWKCSLGSKSPYVTTFSSDEKYLINIEGESNEDGTKILNNNLKVIDMKTGEVMFKDNVGNTNKKIQLIEDGNRILIMPNKSIIEYNLKY